MYVLCAGMYRACSTWQYEVISHLLERHRNGRRLGYLTGEEFAASHERNGGDGGWQVLKSHEGHRKFADAVNQGRAIVVYAHRDIRDVVYSLMHKRGLTFEQLVRQGMIHQVLVNDRFWSGQSHILTQRYERMVAQPEASVLQLAEHLGVEISSQEAAEIAAEYSFQTNRRRTLELVNRLRSQGIDLDDPANRQYYDQRTLLHWNHLREGRPGNWRKEATLKQRAVLSRLCDDWLINHGYDADTLDPLTETQSGRDVLQREVDLARGWLACTLRCASLRHPKIARTIKSALGIAADAPTAVPARTAANVRIDTATATTDITSPRGPFPEPHLRGDHAERPRAFAEGE